MPRKYPPETQSWWATRWLAVAEGSGADAQSRLSRGWSYAHNGAVLDAEVRPGSINAVVRGSAWRPHAVHISLPTLPDEVWQRVTAILASQATFVAQLLAGQMPPEIEWVFTQAGASLFPTTVGEMSAACDCFDGAYPCKHIAAVHYVLAAHLDKDPSVLLVLRGRSLEDLTAALRERWAAAEDGADGADGADPATGAPPALALTAPLRAAGFYRAGEGLDTFTLTIEPAPGDAVLVRRLGKPPFAGPDEDPVPALMEVYAMVTKRALQALGRSGEHRRKRKR
ncbi:MAG TPA: SWIM zinc finger family protein [Ktedonobacterales bacterium]|jgi:uncharacterized Zn finger protein